MIRVKFSIILANHLSKMSAFETLKSTSGQLSINFHEKIISVSSNVCQALYNYRTYFDNNWSRINRKLNSLYI